MTLNPQPSYPSARHYVIKIHRECGSGQGPLRGQLEHIASGRHIEFADAADLLLGLLHDLAAVEREALESLPRDAGSR